MTEPEEFGINKGLPNVGEHLEGSILGEALKGIHSGVYVAPTLGIDFVLPWEIQADGA